MTDYRALWEETAREALRWRKHAENLEDAIGEYLASRPGTAGRVKAALRLRAAVGDDEDE